MAKKKGSTREAAEAVLHEFAEDAGLPGLLDAAGVGSVVEIALEDIKPNPKQPRQNWDHARIRELAASIAEQGVLQPILVRPHRGKYQIVAGERRWRAAQEAELSHIPALVYDWDERSALLVSLVENIQREDLNQVDRGQAFRQLKEVLGDVSWENLGKRVGLTKRRILQLISLSELPEEMQDAIRTAEITEKHGRALNLLADERALQKGLFEQMRDAELTGDQTLYAAKLLGDGHCQTAEEAVAWAKRDKGRPGFSQPATTPIKIASRIHDALIKLDRMTASHSLEDKEREQVSEYMEMMRGLAEKISARMRERDEEQKRQLERLRAARR